MARRTNRGRGGKKNSKLHEQAVNVALDVDSRSLDRDVEVSVEEENCESLDHGNVNAKGLGTQRLLSGGTSFVESSEDLEVFVLPEVEVMPASEGKKLQSDNKIGLPDVDPVGMVDHKNLAQDWRQLF